MLVVSSARPKVPWSHFDTWWDCYTAINKQPLCIISHLTTANVIKCQYAIWLEHFVCRQYELLLALLLFLLSLMLSRDWNLSWHKLFKYKSLCTRIVYQLFRIFQNWLIRNWWLQLSPDVSVFLPDWFGMICPCNRTVSKVAPHFPSYPSSINLRC